MHHFTSPVIGYTYCDRPNSASKVISQTCDCLDCWRAFLGKYDIYLGINQFDMRFYRPFLSGPITGVPDAADVFHAAARDIGERINRITAIRKFVLNPIFIPELIGEDREHGEYMRVSLAMLETASAIVMLPGWHKSRGAKMELAAALRSGSMVIAEWVPEKGGSHERG